MENEIEKEMTRDDFMSFFRNTEKLNLLTPDDRIEVFSTILLGSSDFKKKLVDDIFSDYCVTNLEVIEVDESSSFVQSILNPSVPITPKQV
jgi:hypothetical protein